MGVLVINIGKIRGGEWEHLKGGGYEEQVHWTGNVGGMVNG